MRCEASDYNIPQRIKISILIGIGLNTFYVYDPFLYTFNAKKHENVLVNLYKNIFIHLNTGSQVTTKATFCFCQCMINRHVCIEAMLIEN